MCKVEMKKEQVKKAFTEQEQKKYEKLVLKLEREEKAR
jgi:hypothetical protein